MQKATQRVLVSGVAGFIGSHICERLLDIGNEVNCLGNLFTGSRSDIKHLDSYNCFGFVWHDVIQPRLIDADQIYNLACPDSSVHYQYNPVKTVQTNVVETYNLLELAGQVCARILQNSTSNVYEDPNFHPQPETYWGHVTPIGHRTCYLVDLVTGLIKLMACEADNLSNPINRGCPGEVSMNELATQISDIGGTQLRIEHSQLRVDSPKQGCPDITRAKERLVWG